MKAGAIIRSEIQFGEIILKPFVFFFLLSLYIQLFFSLSMLEIAFIHRHLAEMFGFYFKRQCFKPQCFLIGTFGGLALHWVVCLVYLLKHHPNRMLSPILVPHCQSFSSY